MSSNYPPGTSATDPRAPWNQPDDTGKVEGVIAALDGQLLYESGNHDLDGTLDCYGGLVEFVVPDLYSRKWAALSEAEKHAFDRYAEAVQMFAALYEQGMAQDR